MRTRPEVLRIAQVAPLWTSIPPVTYGGAELVVHWLTEELVKRGHDVTLFASGDSNTNARLRAVCRFNVVEAMAQGQAHEYDHYANRSLVEAIRESENFDVIHCHLGYRQIPLALLSKTAVLFTPHTLPFADDLWMLKQYPNVAIAAVSHHQAKAISLKRRNHMWVIHHGIDFSRYAPSACRGKYLAFVGRMGPQKSPLDAIRIANIARMPLVLAGRPQNADEDDYFASEIKPLIDSANVTYVGSVNHSEKSELLRNAGALLFPIQGEEAFGLIIVESMACGTPVVAIDRASVSEMIDFGKTGFYAKSIEELALLVREALSLDRESVLRYAMQRFSHERMVDQYVQVYRSLLEKEQDNANCGKAPATILQR